MATSTNGIATRSDCNTIQAGAFSQDLNKCPTRAEIIATGVLSVNGSYAENQEVRFSDIIASASSIRVEPTSYSIGTNGGQFSITVFADADWVLASYPSQFCTVDITYGSSGSTTVNVTVSDNPTFEVRSGEFRFSMGSNYASCILTQIGQSLSYRLTNNNTLLDATDPSLYSSYTMVMRSVNGVETDVTFDCLYTAYVQDAGDYIVAARTSQGIGFTFTNATDFANNYPYNSVTLYMDITYQGDEVGRFYCTAYKQQP